jgi:hypothetical protein
MYIAVIFFQGCWEIWPAVYDNTLGDVCVNFFCMVAPVPQINCVLMWLAANFFLLRLADVVPRLETPRCSL